MDLVLFHPHNTPYSLASCFLISPEGVLSIFIFECMLKYCIEINLCCIFRWFSLKMSILLTCEFHWDFVKNPSKLSSIKKMQLFLYLSFA